MRALALMCVLFSGCALAHERVGPDAAVCVGMSRPTHTLGPPTQHRASALDCPIPRGAIAPTPACDVASDPSCAMARCVTDADCTEGVNGRCSHLHRGPADIRLFCTYDECARDDDCGAGLCLCRATSESSDANGCLTAGNCRVDSV